MAIQYCLAQPKAVRAEPFILRGVTLAGVDSVMGPFTRRIIAWGRLANGVPKELLEANTECTRLAGTIDLAG